LTGEDAGVGGSGFFFTHEDDGGAAASFAPTAARSASRASYQLSG